MIDGFRTRLCEFRVLYLELGTTFRVVCYSVGKASG